MQDDSSTAFLADLTARILVARRYIAQAMQDPSTVPADLLTAAQSYVAAAEKAGVGRQ